MLLPRARTNAGRGGSLPLRREGRSRIGDKLVGVRAIRPPRAGHAREAGKETRLVGAGRRVWCSASGLRSATRS